MHELASLQLCTVLYHVLRTVAEDMSFLLSTEVYDRSAGPTAFVAQQNRKALQSAQCLLSEGFFAPCRFSLAS